MPGGAHHRAEIDAVIPNCGRRENGFTLTEIIVVIVLIAIALGAALTTLMSVRRSGADTRTVAAASTIWRGVGSFRLDNKGAFPDAGDLANAGQGFTNLAGARYVKNWPEDPATGRPLELQRGSGTPADTGPANGVLYSVAGERAWLAAYGHDGRLVFLRGIGSGTMVPVG